MAGHYKVSISPAVLDMCQTLESSCSVPEGSIAASPVLM